MKGPDPEWPCLYMTYEQTYGLKCLVLALEAILFIGHVTRVIRQKIVSSAKTKHFRPYVCS